VCKLNIGNFLIKKKMMIMMICRIVSRCVIVKMCIGVIFICCKYQSKVHSMKAVIEKQTLIYDVAGNSCLLLHTVARLALLTAGLALTYF